MCRDSDRRTQANQTAQPKVGRELARADAGELREYGVPGEHFSTRTDDRHRHGTCVEDRLEAGGGLRPVVFFRAACRNNRHRYHQPYCRDADPQMLHKISQPAGADRGVVARDAGKDRKLPDAMQRDELRALVHSSAVDGTRALGSDVLKERGVRVGP